MHPTITIDASAMPAGAELSVGYFQISSGEQQADAALINTSSYTCTSTSTPPDPNGPFGPHRFYAGEGGANAELRGARFNTADLRGARFTDCDLTGVTIRDGWLVDVSISGYRSNVTVNGVEVTDFVSAELDRRHPERVQFREGQTADDVRAI